MVAKKLVVKVERARNLMPKDGQGSTSAFVQVVFDGIRKTTKIIKKDLNPIWEETIEFPINDIADMVNEILEVNVFDSSWKPVGKKNKFLGRVLLHGSTFVKQGEESSASYRLDKRGMFSLVKGELALTVFYIDDAPDGIINSSDALNAERGALNAERAALNAERAVIIEERAAWKASKSSGHSRELSENKRENAGSAEIGAKSAAKSSVTPPPPATKSGVTPPSPPATKSSITPLPPTATSSAAPPRPAAKSSRHSQSAPPSRQPPVPSPTLPPVTSQSPGKPSASLPATAESSNRPPTLSPAVAESSEQNLENSPSPGETLLNPTPSLHVATSKPAEMDNPPPTPLALPPKVVEPPLAMPETPLPASEMLPNLADLLPNISVTPLAMAESPEAASNSPPEPSQSEKEALSPAVEEPPNTQPNREVCESVPKGIVQFEMKPGKGSSEESVPSIESLSNVELVQPNIAEADYALKDTRPELGRDKTSRTDLVEKMHYLFVRVVKARSLMAKDDIVYPNPYTLVALGNQLAKTKTIPNSLYPEWNQAFAFGHPMNASTLEISLWDHHSPPLHDTFLGAVFFSLSDIPTRFPPDSPLAPEWFRLEQKHGEHHTVSGDIMLSVWIGTQADDAFCDAWHSDTGGNIATTRAKVYLSPKLWYLRLTVIEAQDLQTPDAPQRLPEVSVKVQLGFQTARTRVAKRRSISPFWNEDLMLVASEPWEESVLLTVEDHQGPDKHEIIGTVQIPLEKVERRVDDRQVASRWFNLQHDSDNTRATLRFQGRIHLRVCLDGGYHVMDETTHLSSDMRPSAKQLWKAPIGVLELGILGAHNLQPMKNKGGSGTTDAYCVAKYGPKWVRTRTILDSLSPRWNEQYTWEVYDPCTVLTLCVFDNGELVERHQHQQHNNKHARVGKVRVRLSTLEVDRVYTISYPLLVLQPGGLKKLGDMEVAVRFSCVSMFHLIHTYTKPLLPRMHYLYPLSIQQQEVLRTAAMKMVALRLSRCEPPLRPEVVQYLLDADSSLWSMRRSKANWFRISHMMGGFYAILTWMKDIRQWRNPVTTLLVHVLFIILLCYPELILPTIFFYMFLIGLWQYRSRNRSPPHIDPHISHADVADRDELDEEFDTSPTSKPPDIVKLRYERLRGIAGRIQMVLGDIATQGERLHGLLTWRDPRATSIFVTLCFVTAVWLYIAPFRLAAFLVGIHFLRHPRFRNPLPSSLLNFFRRLPTQSDRIL